MTYTLFLPYVSGGKPVYDMSRYVFGDGRIFRCDNSHGSSQFHQTQPGAEEGVEYQVKNQEWEEFWFDDQHIYRGMDVSMGGGSFYTLRDSIDGRWSKWCPRFWSPGDAFYRNPFVTVYDSGCNIITHPTQVGTWLRFVAHLPSWQKVRHGEPVGLPVANVAVFHWLWNEDDQIPLETYYYADGYGLVGFGDGTKEGGLESWIAYECEPGECEPERRLPRPCGL